MLGPLAAALMVPLPADHALARSGEQQRALEHAAATLAAQKTRGRADYYSGSWRALATLTLSGLLPSLAPAVADPGAAVAQRMGRGAGNYVRKNVSHSRLKLYMCSQV